MERIGTQGSFLIWSNHENAVFYNIRRQMGDYGYHNSALEKWLDRVVRFEGHPSDFMVDMCEIAKLVTSIRR